MGSRKRNSAEKIKEAKKDLAFAKLNNCPTSPRKMRLVADQIRGCLLYTSPSPRDRQKSRMPSSA